MLMLGCLTIFISFFRPLFNLFCYNAFYYCVNIRRKIYLGNILTVRVSIFILNIIKNKINDYRYKF